MPAPTRHSNPFATCWTNPRAMPWLAAHGSEPGELAERLAAANWRGQIVGPHGVGKSTLLAALRDHIEATGREWIEINLCCGRRGEGWWALRSVRPGPSRLLVIDGFEQLGRLARSRVCWRSWQSAGGLLVTTHQSVGLPTLARLAPHWQTARQLFAHLTLDRDTPLAEADLADAFNACKGNMRETLFYLYDLHERRIRAGFAANIPRPNVVT